VCIDLTTLYENRLLDLSPVDLSISDELSEELSAKLFKVETGLYGAGDEKKALKEFADRLRGEIEQSVKKFLTSDDDKQNIGLINLEEISNTKATLYITELYLTCILHFARDNPEGCPPILIVVEEAHTVMPEPTTMGLGDYESKGLVGKIAQIALQGRKYDVGLLVIAQRTATVSKSVLTQCNTIVSFTCFDDTSLGFLNNIFGRTHTQLIPNLPPLNAVVFGKGVRTERPIIVQIPYSEEKAKYDT
jgi:DNA helicase HerA-like ATPase